MIDPYPLPFEWHESLSADVDLLGLIPCDCESGWLPELGGEFVECPVCRK